MVLIEVSVVPGYNQLSQQISDLGAYVLYGSYSALQNLNFWVSGILIAAFAIGLRKALPVLRAVTWPLGVSGVMIFLSGVFQDQPFPWPGSAHALIFLAFFVSIMLSQFLAWRDCVNQPLGKSWVGADTAGSH